MNSQLERRKAGKIEHKRRNKSEKKQEQERQEAERQVMISVLMRLPSVATRVEAQLAESCCC